MACPLWSLQLNPIADVQDGTEIKITEDNLSSLKRDRNILFDIAADTEILKWIGLINI